MFYLIISLTLVFGLWIALRFSVRAGLRPLVSLLLDFGVVVLGWGLFLSITARPIFAALVVIGLGIGLMVVDGVKRAVLREPVLFADRSELVELVRHPALYLPFAGTSRVLGGVAAMGAGLGALLWAEAPLWRFSLLPPLLGVLITLALLTLPGRPWLLPRLRRLYEGLAPSRKPAADAQRFGLLAGFVIHATLARAERAERRRGLAPRRTQCAAVAGTIVLVQQESFFDVGRLECSLGRDVLPGFTTCRESAVLAGRLAVPCWGANTVRTEFAVLSGLPEARLGLDRFNPYAAFAQVPIESLAWRARAAGWRTICVHPFDLSFYARRWVLPMLGFETLIGPEAFVGARRGGLYVADAEVAARVAELLDREPPGRGILVFVITMEGHGPWDVAAADAVLPLPEALAGIAEALPLARFLYRLREADRAVPMLTSALQRRGGRGVLACYGDHQPSLPKAFAALGFDDRRTDYMMWATDGAAMRERRDLAAHELAGAVCAAGGLAWG